MDEIIIHLEDVYPWVEKEHAQRILLRYLHDRGIEGGIGSDEIGTYIRYYRPSEDVSVSLYEFITKGSK
jgi:hypothetical protein